MRKLFRSRVFFSIFAIAVVLLLIFLNWLNATKPLDTAIGWVFNPINKTFYSLGQSTREFFGSQDDLDMLEEENQLLKDQIDHLLIEKSQLIDENKALLEINPQLVFLDEMELNSQAAQVVGLNTTGDSKIYLLNKGSNDGIKPGYPVIVGKGLLIGKIIDSGSSISKLQLITSNSSLLSGEIQNEQSSQGLLQGDVGISLNMSLIPQDDQIEEKQLVITSGLDDNIPRGLLIGTISRLTTKTGELFQSVSITPISPLDKLNIVSIIIPQ